MLTLNLSTQCHHRRNLLDPFQGNFGKPRDLPLGAQSLNNF